LRDDAGRHGLGEARALKGFGSSPDRLDAFLADPAAIQRLLDVLQDEGRASHAPGDVPVEALFAAETALSDVAAQCEGRPLVEYLGFARTDALSNSTLVTSESEALPLLDAGHRNFKLKARGVDEACLALASRLVDASNGEARLRIDANGSWDRGSARDFLARAPRDALVFIEQPFPIGDLESCAWLQEYADIPVALDEGAESPGAVAAAARAGAARLVIVKPMYRGLRGALQLAAAAAEHGLGACVTHAMDGTVGRVATMHVAAAVDEICRGPTWPHGLYAPGLTSLADEPLLKPDSLSLPDGAGLGCSGLRDADLALVSASQ
jgi:L-alanine-DL-glutamate epimerase-like enolase superfamily enzyme